MIAIGVLLVGCLASFETNSVIIDKKYKNFNQDSMVDRVNRDIRANLVEHTGKVVDTLETKLADITTAMQNRFTELGNKAHSYLDNQQEKTKQKIVDLYNLIANIEKKKQQQAEPSTDKPTGSLL